MKLRFAAPALLVDINRVAGLDVLEEDGRNGGALRIGALVRTSTLEHSPLVAARYPTLAAAAPLISDPIVRNLGTLVGSLAADPAGRLGLGAAGARGRGRRPQQHRRAAYPDHRVFRRAVYIGAAA